MTIAAGVSAAAFGLPLGPDLHRWHQGHQGGAVRAR